MLNLPSELVNALSDRYTFERELAGGGMSRVFVAEETRLGRKVVVKVVSTDLAYGISAERFEREIRTAAALQQANIVPVLFAGEAGGLPYYTMPFVEGESLRTRLSFGPFSITEAVSVLRDVARALAFAHAHGVVHRDIKPDNVLLSGGTAVVTDFGIAKAISAARTSARQATLTEIGASVGTPAYMAPEQAAGDPDIDHRADLYSFGCMAFELLTGGPPFAGRTPQRVIAAHLSEAPQDVAALRPDVPAVLAELVNCCLAKDAANRPQSADAVVHTLEAITNSQGLQPMPPPMLQARRVSFRRALVYYVLAFVAVGAVAWVATAQIGLPSWVVPGALLIMSLGFPLVLFTGYAQRVTPRAVPATPSVTPGSLVTQGRMDTLAFRASPHLSWRRTMLAGAWALTAFVVLVGGYMLLRALGVGPMASLLASGAMRENEPLLIADFDSPASDSTLGIVVTEALRTDLSQSKRIAPVQPTVVRDALRRMRRPALGRLDVSLARELATREGIKAVLAGDVLPAGHGFVLSARLLSAQTGDVIAAFRENAKDPDQVIPAIDRLSAAVRGKIGESLRSVNATPPLSHVTTASLEALRRYTEGARAIDGATHFTQGVQLVQDAIAIDTAFWAAYRMVAGALGVLGVQPARRREYLERAYAHRERMTDLERYLTETSYYGSAWHYDSDSGIAASQALVEAGGAAAGYANLGGIYSDQRDPATAVQMYRKSIAADSTNWFPYAGVVLTLAALGRWDEVRVALEHYARRFPDSPSGYTLRALVFQNDGLADSAGARIERARLAASADAESRRFFAITFASVERRAGHLRAASSYRAMALEAATAVRDRGFRFTDAADRAVALAWFVNDTAGALKILDAALARGALDSLDDFDRPYLSLAKAYAWAGRPDKARALADAFDRQLPHARRPADVSERNMTAGLIAMADRRYADAVRDFRAADVGQFSWSVMPYPYLARAFDLSGQPDSAIAAYQGYLAKQSGWRALTDAFFLAPAHKRLGELYEAKGDFVRSPKHYEAFVELWRNADPELQPWVAQVRAKLATLRGAQ